MGISLGDAVAGEVRRASIVPQESLADDDQPIGEAVCRGRRGGADNDGESITVGKHSKDCPHGVGIDRANAIVDLANHQELGSARQTVRERQARTVHGTKPLRGLGRAIAEPDSLEGAQRRLALRLSRKPQEPVQRAMRSLGREDVPEKRPALDRARAQVRLRHQGSDAAEGASGHRESVHPHAPLVRDDPSGHGVQQRSAFCGVAGDDDSDLAPPEAGADPVEEPATVPARGADTEQLDHARIFRGNRYEIMTDP